MADSIHTVTQAVKGFGFTTSYSEEKWRLINEVTLNTMKGIFTSKGIWDTGANSSCIQHDYAELIGLKPKKESLVRGIMYSGARPIYEAEIVLPGGIVIPKVELVETNFPDAEFDIVIGMDIISLGDFAVSNYDGKTVFTFRYPSQGKIDFIDYKGDKGNGKEEI